MTELRQLHQGKHHAGAVAFSSHRWVGHVCNTARGYIDDVEHPPAIWATLPRGPSVRSTAVDVSNGLISLPREVLVSSRLLGPSELTKGSVGQIENQPGPAGASKH